MCIGFWWCMMREFNYHGVVFDDIFLKNHLFFGSDDKYLGMTLDMRVYIYKQVKSAVLIAFVLQQYITCFARKRRLAPAMRWGHPMDLFDNPYLNGGLLISLIMLVAVVYVPGLQIFFDIRPPSPYAWLYPILPGFVLSCLIETRKYFIRRFGPNSRFAQLFDY